MQLTTGTRYISSSELEREQQSIDESIFYRLQKDINDGVGDTSLSFESFSYSLGPTSV